MASPEEIDATIQAAAKQYNLPVDLFRKQLMAESGLDPNAVNHTSGAAGIAQFMPETAKAMGVDPMDPQQAIPAAAQYMRQNLNRFGGDYDTALTAYNWGPGNVARLGVAAAPPATRAYIARIRGGGPSGAVASLPTPPVSPPTPGQGQPAAPPAPGAPAFNPALLAGLASPASSPPGVPGSLADAFTQAANRAKGVA